MPLLSALVKGRHTSRAGRVWVTTRCEVDEASRSERWPVLRRPKATGGVYQAVAAGLPTTHTMPGNIMIRQRHLGLDVNCGSRPCQVEKLRSERPRACGE